jgi:uncharacterized membrane protein YedE/YeeE
MTRSPLLSSAVVFGAGVLFAGGLALSGMTRPGKVIAFLDPLSGWDPSLAFVMVGGILTHMLAYRLVLRRPSPLLASAFLLPTRKDISPALLVGAALFGVGWGLGGFCPGPGLAAAASGAAKPAVFAASMLLGMFVFKLWNDAQQRRAARQAPVSG